MLPQSYLFFFQPEPVLKVVFYSIKMNDRAELIAHMNNSSLYLLLRIQHRSSTGVSAIFASESFHYQTRG